ncbi:hypothetical protein DICPUDRAFT_75884 [Dictyostelium purpureum]|uniref:Uncharacterized protein n=1 Tax=Dictyostelium purpureum TaxID=5786 RepID=F0ZBY6_DICPU|nr:uncharacterized protein DICPUDRAFT_75884 [Dictyostelium purpureum]EGC38566.1 hypothetical protein DICPUDRAFT_75884 [Dictyostelium purpureum]|eukprot:XP_003284937.1 hypothetical protein DICPUDRAFT_75884 [Dictyostelium purpureum]
MSHQLNGLDYYKRISLLNNASWGNIIRDTRMQLILVFELLKLRSEGQMKRNQFYQGVGLVPFSLTLPTLAQQNGKSINKCTGSTGKLYLLEDNNLFIQHNCGDLLLINKLFGAKVVPISSYESFIDQIINIFFNLKLIGNEEQALCLDKNNCPIFARYYINENNPCTK